jgi:carboxymethylenebutenolidase
MRVGSTRSHGALDDLEEQVATIKLDVNTADGVMDVYLHPAPGGAAAPVVVLYPDAGGVRPAMHEMADRLASHGYCVAVPNVLYRSGKFAPFDMKTVWSDPSERARLSEVIKKADALSVMRDTASLLDAVSKYSGARSGPIGCVGYCMGGRLAFTASGAHPSRVAAAASIHGGNLATDDATSPHRQAARIGARLYFAVADNDGSCTPEHQTVLKAALDAANVRYQIELYPGASHGFAPPDSPVYDRASSERQWERVIALFGETLQAKQAPVSKP